jgi:LPXTG-motif cell wall-anchored protein
MKRVALIGALVLGGILIGSPAQAETYVPGPVESTVTSVPAPPDLGEPAESKLPQTGSDGRVLQAWGAGGVVLLIAGGAALMYSRREGAL